MAAAMTTARNPTSTPIRGNSRNISTHFVDGWGRWLPGQERRRDDGAGHQHDRQHEEQRVDLCEIVHHMTGEIGGHRLPWDGCRIKRQPTLFCVLLECCHL